MNTIKKATYWVVKLSGTAPTYLKGTKEQVEHYAETHRIDMKNISYSPKQSYTRSSNKYNLVSIPKNIIQEWMKEHKLLTLQAELLLEAYRRYHMFRKPEGKSLTQGWTGLGGADYDNCKYFNRSSSSSPAWFTLNQSGADIVSDLIKRLPWEDEYNGQLYTDSYKLVKKDVYRRTPK